MANTLGALNDRGINDAVQRRLQIQNPDYDLTLMPELAIVMPLGDATPELYFHMKWNRWIRGQQIAAVAAQNGQVRIGNPDTSGRLVVVERVLITSAAADFAGTMGTAVGSTSLGTLITGQDFQDGRQRFGSSAVQISTTTTVAPFAPTSFQLSIGAFASSELPYRNVVLNPGSTLTIQCQTVNNAFNWCFVWRERGLMDQENTL